MNDWKQRPRHTTAEESARVVHERKPLPENEFSAVLSAFVRARARTKYHAPAARNGHKSLIFNSLRQAEFARMALFVQHRCWTKPLWEWAVGGGR
jgi:hypothetical protein